MREVQCPVCKRSFSTTRRATYCREKHRWQGWWERAQEQSEHAQALPLAPLPPGADEMLPIGPERLRAAAEMLLVGKAPSGSCGYRVGIRHGRSKIMLWFPASKLVPQGMFGLEPFQQPDVPVPGTYAVVYMDQHFKPLGGPSFTIGIDHANKRLRYSDGDRTYKPRSQR